jgi:RHS repeat-associated protein
MIRTYRFLFLVIVLALVPGAASAQVATGTPPFSSLSGGPDTVNLASLNVHQAFPIFHKPGRGIPFNFDLTHDTIFWQPVTSNGTTSWSPGSGTGGFGGSPVNVGYLAYAVLYDSEFIYYCGFNYYDGFGTSHAFTGCAAYDYVYGYDYPLTTTTTDDSGYTLSADAAYGVASLTAADGNHIIPQGTTPLGQGVSPGSVIDRNGNEITADTSGNYTDTLGMVALQGTGSAANPPYTLTYQSPAGTSAPTKVSFRTYSIQTNFGCSGVGEYGPLNASMVDRITLPDGTYYQFNYEPTPGYSGEYTGRLASVTLPTGGIISYTYTGAHNGIICTDGSSAGLTRTTPDGTWTYTRAPGSGAASTTTVTDPQNSQTVIQFQRIYETERQAYQGSSTGGTLLKTIITCYNGNTSNCPSTAITLPIRQRTVFVQLPGTNSLKSRQDSFYNSYGLETQTNEYAYGAGAPGALLRQTLVTYASLGNGIVNQPATVTVKDGFGNVRAQTTYAYDQGTPTSTSGTPQHVAVSGSRGNPTTITYLVQGSATLSRTRTYFDTGRVKTVTDANLAQTSYTYGACGNSFPTSITEPLSLSKSLMWNCTGGVESSITDENNQTVTTTYNDSFFWRPATVTDQLSNATNFTYNGATSVESSLFFNSNNSTVDSLTNVDSLGRSHVSQTKEGPSSSTYDSVETDYDSLGRPSRTTLPYAGAAGQTNSSAPSTTTAYDALGRASSVTDGGGGTNSFSYSQNDIYLTTGPAPSGENAKRKQLEYDALARLTSVCEITPGTGSGTCSQKSSATGYWTQYTHDVLDNLTGVTQNAQSASNIQTRAYTYDGKRRVTSERNPESGTTYYTYDTDTTCGTYKGDLVKKVDAVGNTTCYAYDALHRVTSMTYPSGPYASVTPNKYFVYDSATVNSVAMTYAKGRLAEAYTCFSPCSSKTTDEGFSYTVRGEPSDIYESTPHGGYYHVSQTYWANGAVNQISGLSVLPTITYNVDGKGRTYSASASSGQYPLTSTTYNAADQPTQVLLGSGDSDAFSYDANTNRMTQYKFTVGGQAYVGTLTWNAVGTLNSMNTTNPYAGHNHTCSYSHDDLTRVASASCSDSSQTFVYDAFGNIDKNGSPSSFMPAYSYLTNHMTQIGSSTPTYDANGNVTNDFLNAYSWDAAGKAATVGGNPATYDAFGRVAEITSPAHCTFGTCYPASYVQIVYVPSGTKLARMNGASLLNGYMPLTGGARALYNASGLSYYGHSDWRGSSVVASTSTATFFDTYDYDSFGYPYNEGSGWSGGAMTPLFTGVGTEFQQCCTSLYDFPAREYGYNSRWASPDPAGLAAVDQTDPQTWNRYAYVRNSPLNLVDPTGTDGCDPESGCGGGGWSDCFFGCGGGGGGGLPGPSLPAGIHPTFPTSPGIDYSWPNLLFGPPDPSLLVFGWGEDRCPWLPPFSVWCRNTILRDNLETDQRIYDMTNSSWDSWAMAFKQNADILAQIHYLEHTNVLVDMALASHDFASLIADQPWLASYPENQLAGIASGVRDQNNQEIDGLLREAAREAAANH